MSRQHHPSRPVTLLLSTMALPAAPRLADAARRRGWGVASLAREPQPLPHETEIVFYGSTLEAVDVAERFDLALLEPPLDLLARLPYPFLLRQVSYARWNELPESSAPMFLKPADPLAKVFDAGVYRGRGEVRCPRPLPYNTPVLAAEPVEWLAEYRCFLLEGEVVAASPYLSFGRPLHHSLVTNHAVPVPVLDVCRRLTSSPNPTLPRALVVDIGLIEDKGWAVVEFNPAWCAGLLSADPERVLDVLRRSCRGKRSVSEADRRWIVKRPTPAIGLNGKR